MSTATSPPGRRQDPADPLVGQLLDGRYRVARRLARGGMATVYEALDTRLARIVALKVMHPGLAEDSEFVTRFIREAHSAAQLSHPCVVAVYDQSADSGHVFIAMEYVPGRTLRDWLADRVRLTPRETFAVLEPVLAALAAAHSAGLVHRDVKPENVLIADDGRVKVADFGLARAVSNATTTGALIGTVAYLAPELVEHGVADRHSDVYSAGILLYECLTGRAPFTGDTPMQVAYQHVHLDVPPPSAVRPGLAAELDDLVRRATARDPRVRPTDAGQFLAEVVAVRRNLSTLELDDPGAAAAANARHVAGTGELTVPQQLPIGAGDQVGRGEAAEHLGGPNSSGARLTAPIPRGPAEGTPTRLIPVPRSFARRRRHGRLVLLALLVSAVLVGIGGWRLAVGSTTATPALLNLTRAQATAATQAVGLEIRFGEEFSENVPQGRVLRTDPASGHRIPKGGAVAAVLSKGPERYAVPQLRRIAVEQARDSLAAANLTVGSVTRAFDPEVPAGQVISSRPPAGTELKRDAQVSLVISEGGRPVELPDLVGIDVTEATRILQRIGFVVRVQQVPATGLTVPGEVVGQDPGPGRASAGSTVLLRVADGPPLTSVPNLIGMTRAQAQRTLEDLGLEAEFDGGLSLLGTGNRVESQDPPAGSRVPAGSTVRLELG